MKKILSNECISSGTSLRAEAGTIGLQRVWLCGAYRQYCSGKKINHDEHEWVFKEVDLLIFRDLRGDNQIRGKIYHEGQ
jgi:hypothetical protein